MGRKSNIIIFTSAECEYLETQTWVRTIQA